MANERNGRNRNSATAAGRNNNRRGGKRTSAGAGNATNSSNKNKKQKKLLGVPDLRAGQLGEIEVYADGTAKFVIGECRFDLKDGTAYRHHEQFNIIDEKKKKMRVCRRYRRSSRSYAGRGPINRAKLEGAKLQ